MAFDGGIAGAVTGLPQKGWSLCPLLQGACLLRYANLDGADLFTGVWAFKRTKIPAFVHICTRLEGVLVQRRTQGTRPCKTVFPRHRDRTAKPDGYPKAGLAANRSVRDNDAGSCAYVGNRLVQHAAAPDAGLPPGSTYLSVMRRVYPTAATGEPLYVRPKQNPLPIDGSG